MKTACPIGELGSIAEIVMGLSPPGKTYNRSGKGLPLLNGPTDFGDSFPSCTLFTTDSRRVAKAGDILFCVRGSTTGRMNWADHEYSIGRGIASIRAMEHSDTRYLRGCIDALLPSLMQKASGSTFPNISFRDLATFRVPIPPLSAQRKIAAVLFVYDDLIENNNRRIKLLEELAQRIYREWFVDFRYPGHEKVPLVESGMGMIPDGWVIEPLRDVVAFDIGGGWGADDVSSSHDHFAWVIRGTDIPRVRSGDVSTCPGRYHTASNLRSRVIRHGDIVFELSGGSKGQPVGRSALISSRLLEEMKGDVICASFCKLIRPNPEVLSPEILNFRFLDAYENGEIGTYQVQSTGITNLRFSQLLDSLHVAIPPKAVQAEFVNCVGTLTSSVHLLGVQNRNLRTTRDLLLPRLISGEIDVNGLDVAMPEVAA